MIGIIIGLMFATGTLLQTQKLLKVKDSTGISIPTYIITALAIFLSILVAIYENAWNLVISNTISCILVTMNLCLIIRYRGTHTGKDTTKN